MFGLSQDLKQNKGSVMPKIRLVAVALLLASGATYADSLNEAVQFSMITNPEVLFNTARGLSAKQAIDKAKGAYWPSVDLTGGSGREKSDNPTTRALEGAGPQILNRIESNVELRQSLFAGGGIVNEIKRNEFLWQGQMWKTQGVAEDLALNVVERYLSVLLHEKLLALADKNLLEHRHVFSMIKDRGEAGLARAAEVDQATARLALAEANRITAEANLREARIAYAKVVGKWPEHLHSPHVPTRSELPKTLPMAIERGLDNHPTVKATYADVKQAKSQYEVAQAAYMPRVDLVLSAGRNRNLDGLVGKNDDNLAMVRMTYNVFRGGADMARVRETAYQVQEAFEVKNRALIDLKEAIRLSWNAWQASGLRLSPLKTHVSASFKTREAYAEQFKVGKRTLLDLLDSQNEYYQAQIEYARGQNDEVFSRFRILNGMGCLLPYLNMKLPVNVVNNDVFSSAQTHVLLNKEMDKIPYPDVTDHNVGLISPVPSMDQAHLTPAITNKNTSSPPPVNPKIWYVYVGGFKTKTEAIALVNRLTRWGFIAFTCPYRGYDSVFIGPYNYKGHAANGMERLREVAHVQGRLVTFKGPLKIEKDGSA